MTRPRQTRGLFIRPTSLLALAIGVSGCGGSSDDSPVTVTAPTVTATAPEATVTEDAVTATSEAVTVTPPAVTVTPPAVTETAPEVTLTGAAGESEGAEAGTALGALSSLPVKGKAGKGGYNRDKFGSPWTDSTSAQGARNGCDTRNDVLRRDLEDLAVEGGTAGCVALTGSLSDPYSGDELPFVKGEDSASQIHIDHLLSVTAIRMAHEFAASVVSGMPLTGAI